MKLDKRRKYYIILDTETATLPFIKNLNDKDSQKMSLMYPLVYDIGWLIIDRKGRPYAKRNFLISETFSIPEIFNTAYYKEKRPMYLEKLKRGEITLTTWSQATDILVKDLQEVYAIGACNSMFDFKKAITFTERYINAVYSSNYDKWLNNMKAQVNYNLLNNTAPTNPNFDKDNFIFRGNKYPLFDVWGMACKHLINCQEYKEMCVKNKWFSPSGKYFSTTAEKIYRFITLDSGFIESHTALDDARIESEIFARIMKPTVKNFERGIIYFPFRILGTVTDYLTQ